MLSKMHKISLRFVKLLIKNIIKLFKQSSPFLFYCSLFYNNWLQHYSTASQPPAEETNYMNCIKFYS